MAFTVLQVGATLQLMNEDGDLTTLTLPTGVTLRTDVPPRWQVFDRYVLLVNTPSRPITIDAAGVVRVLTPEPPRTGAILTAESGGSLSGTYSGVRYTFVILDDDGNIISESGYSPESDGPVVLTSDYLKAANLDLSDDDISARRLYRPVSNGSTLFQWVDLDGNTLTSVQDDLADASLSLVGANPTLGSAPNMTHIAAFRERLFCVAAGDIDHVRYSEAGLRYAWPSDNLLAIPVIGSDAVGITGFLQRREALGVGRLNQLVQITGTGAEDVDAGTIDFDVVLVSKETGIVSQETVDVWRDTGYFLWLDGVYRWGPDGVWCISDGVDGLGMVRSWFATSDYFDRTRFNEAFGHVDPIRNKYRLYLYAPDGELQWVEYDLKDRTWWGPHKTGLFVPRSAFIVTIDNVREPMVGADTGIVYHTQATRTDGPSTAIESELIGKWHDAEEPDLTKFYGSPTIYGQGQSSGLVQVDSIVGDLLNENATHQHKSQPYDLSKSRQKLGILGVGRHMQLSLRHATAGELVKLFGYDFDDVHVVGRR